MVSNNRNITHDNLIREHIIRVNRGHGNDGRGVGNIEKKEEGLRPGCEPAVSSLETFSRKGKRV